MIYHPTRRTYMKALFYPPHETDLPYFPYSLITDTPTDDPDECKDHGPKGHGVRSMREKGRSGCPSGAPLQRSELDYGKPRTVQAEVDKEGRVRACGFEPAKALVRGLPLPLPLSFRDRLGYQLPILSPIEGVGQTTK
ncbi:hypothetical protein HD554DRAFT_2328792 [Boletus coccyginus]|nr:hypothetical protein HD554DRAFT_2328792 [Boletus coccyginus]